MSVHVGRAREEYLAFLREKISESSDEAVRAVLEAAMQEATAYDRSLSPLASLSRLVEACDAIESGEAAVLARKIGKLESRLRAGRTPLNSRTVDAYIRLRAELDIRSKRPTEWTGPRDETLRRPGYLKRYLESRQDALRAKARPTPSSNLKRLEELVAALPTPEDRQDLRFALEKGFAAQRELRLLKKAIETNFPPISLDQLMGQSPVALASNPAIQVNDEHRKSLALLRSKIQDNDELRHFGLINDGVRLKTQHTGAHFLSKEEYEALLTLLQSALN